MIETINLKDGFISRSESGSRVRKDGFNYKEKVETNAICAETTCRGKADWKNSERDVAIAIQCSRGKIHLYNFK